jgi:hypothetical protein
MGKIGEGKLSTSKRRLGVPKGVIFYLKLKGGETVEYLTTSTDLPDTVLADDCLIIKVNREAAKP